MRSKYNHALYPGFYTKEGWLTPYGLACGYIEKENAKHESDIEVTLYKEHTVYHVRVHGLSSMRDRIVRIWVSFDTLTEARKHFKTLVKAY